MAMIFKAVECRVQTIFKSILILETEINVCLFQTVQEGTDQEKAQSEFKVWLGE